MNVLPQVITGISKTVFAAVFLFSGLGWSLVAQESESTPDQVAEVTYKVAIKSTPPFAFQDESGDWSGISVDLWKKIADDLGWSYKFESVEKLEDLLNKVADGEADVALGAITATAERERFLDLTHPYFFTGQALAIHPSIQGKWVWLKNLISVEFMAAIGGLILLLAMTGVGIWMVERKHNASDFGGHWWQGIGSGFWWSAVTMTTVGYGDKAPKTFLGRVFGLIWMFAGLILISGMTAAIASALTVQNLGGNLSRSQKFSDWKIATVKDSSGERFALDQGWIISSYPTAQQAVFAIQGSEVDAILYDRVGLEYMLSQDESLQCEILPGTLNSESYSLALPQNSALRDPLNVDILKIVNDKLIREIQSKYMVLEE